MKVPFSRPQMGLWAGETDDAGDGGFLHTEGVVGSIPTSPTAATVVGFRGYGAAGSASPWHGEGQGFESP